MSIFEKTENWIERILVILSILLVSIFANIKLANDPIKFVEHNGKRFVVDGHHRLGVAKELGIQNVPVQEVQLPYAGYRTVSDLIYSTF